MISNSSSFSSRGCRTRKEQARAALSIVFATATITTLGRFVVHLVLAPLPVMRTGAIIFTLIVAVASPPLAAREHRSLEVTREFQHEHPCPSTGKTTGARDETL
jgi:hypothetical protein